MKSLAMEIDKALHAMKPESARNFEVAVRAMLSLARRNDAASESEFDRLARQEAALRADMHQKNRQFSAGDRLTRDEIHTRHAIH